MPRTPKRELWDQFRRVVMPRGKPYEVCLHCCEGRDARRTWQDSPPELIQRDERALERHLNRCLFYQEWAASRRSSQRRSSHASSEAPPRESAALCDRQDPPVEARSQPPPGQRDDSNGKGREHKTHERARWDGERTLILLDLRYHPETTEKLLAATRMHTKRVWWTELTRRFNKRASTQFTMRQVQDRMVTLHHQNRKWGSKPGVPAHLAKLREYMRKEGSFRDAPAKEQSSGRASLNASEGQDGAGGDRVASPYESASVSQRDLGQQLCSQLLADGREFCFVSVNPESGRRGAG